MRGRMPRAIVVPEFIKYDPVFANNDWAAIIEACHNGAAPETWLVSDSKPMTINGKNYQVDIIGKDHDDYANGGGKAPLTFLLHDCYETGYGMNSSDTNVGGWTDCAMRKTRLPAIRALMPSVVQSGIRKVKKLTSAGSKSANIVTTEDDLFELSEIEIFGSNTYAMPGEGSQYAYFKNGGSTVKRKNGAIIGWWERSPLKTHGTAFCFVDANGKPSGYTSTYPYGVSFAFCF